MTEPPRPAGPEPADRAADGSAAGAADAAASPGRAAGSAPWERPRRWRQQGLQPTRVDDLLARLGNEDEVGRRRRRRADHADGPDAPVAAGDLIAALRAQGDGPEQEAGTVSHAAAGPDPNSDPVTAASGSAHLAAGSPAAGSASEAADDAATTSYRPAAAGSAVSAAAVTPGLPPIEPVAPVGTGDPEITDQLPVLGGVHDVWSIRTSLSKQYPGGQPGRAADRSADIPVSGQRSALQGQHAAAGEQAAGSHRITADRADHPSAHRLASGLLWSGRGVIALIAAAILVIAGLRWNDIRWTNQALKDRGGDYIQTTDPNISTPSQPSSRPAAGSGAAGSIAPAQPAPVYQSENILMLGSDTRAGANSEPGNDNGTLTTAQSDTIMIAHISGDRQRVTVLSIPRDLQIPAPSCKRWDYRTGKLSDEDEPVTSSSRWKITNAYAVGGPRCTVAAVQKLTGLRITSVIVIDFKGFKTMVDALGGVTLSVCRPIKDEELGVIVPQGGDNITIRGEQALNLVRARKVPDDGYGNDYGRIHRQQVVLSAMLRQVTSAGTLLSPSKLDNFLRAFVESTVTDNVTVDSLITLANQLGDLSAGRVTFYSLPAHGNPADGGDSQVMDPIAGKVFEALLNDQPLPGQQASPATPTPSPASRTSGAPGASTPRPPATPPSTPVSSGTSATTSSSSATPQPQTLAVQPDTIDLQVVNLTGRAGVGGQVQQALNAFGFQISDADLLRPEGTTRPDTVVQYSAGQRDAAVVVAAAIPGSTLEQADGLGSRIRLELGTSYDGRTTRVAAGQPVPSRLQTTPATSFGATTPATGAGQADQTSRTTGGSSSPAATATPSTTPSSVSIPSSAIESLNAAQHACA